MGGSPRPTRSLLGPILGLGLMLHNSMPKGESTNTANPGYLKEGAPLKNGDRGRSRRRQGRIRCEAADADTAGRVSYRSANPSQVSPPCDYSIELPAVAR